MGRRLKGGRVHEGLGRGRREPRLRVVRGDVSSRMRTPAPAPVPVGPVPRRKQQKVWESNKRCGRAATRGGRLVRGADHG